MNNLGFPFPVKHYIFTKNTGNLHFVFRVDEQPDPDTIAGTLVDIRKNVPFYASRQMRRNFIDTFGKVCDKPAVLRSIFKYLTEDQSGPHSTEQGEVDNRLMEYLATGDNAELAYDLRQNNGRVKDKKFDPFWKKMEEIINERTVAHERRHTAVAYMPVAVSVRALVAEIKALLPDGTPIPGMTTVKLSFWPCNPYLHSSISYSAEFKVKRAVQQRMVKARHEDANYAFNYALYMKNLAVKFRDNSVFISVDDKAVVPVGDPNNPISTGVRAHNRGLVSVGTQLAAADHDFHVAGVVPSVDYVIDIPESASDSFYKGSIHVTLKDKVFQASSPTRHAAETVQVLREVMSDDGVNLSKPMLFQLSDGGPDHRTIFLSVQLADIALFVALDLDFLAHLRTAPGQSSTNMAERAMSALNFALQNTSTCRKEMDDNFEARMRGLTSLKRLRLAATKDKTIADKFTESMEPVINSLKSRFATIVWQDQNVKVHEAATEDDIKSIEDLLKIIDPSIKDISELKDLGKFPDLKGFVDKHGHIRHYGFQVSIHIVLK